jgi:hypothetical protein
MANYYTLVTAFRKIPCTKKEAKKVQKLIEELEDQLIEHDEYLGLAFEYYEKEGGYLVSSVNADSSRPENLFDTEVAKEIGKLLKKADMEYLEVGVAYTCDKLRESSHGGGMFRIYKNGRVEEAKLVYLEDIELLEKEVKESTDAAILEFQKKIL